MLAILLYRSSRSISWPYQESRLGTRTSCGVETRTVHQAGNLAKKFCAKGFAERARIKPKHVPGWMCPRDKNPRRITSPRRGEAVRRTDALPPKTFGLEWVRRLETNKEAMDDQTLLLSDAWFVCRGGQISDHIHALERRDLQQ